MHHILIHRIWGKMEKRLLLLFLKCELKKIKWTVESEKNKNFKIKRHDVLYGFSLMILKDDLMVVSSRKKKKKKLLFIKLRVSLINVKPWFSNLFLPIICQPQSRRLPSRRVSLWVGGCHLTFDILSFWQKCQNDIFK